MLFSVELGSVYPVHTNFALAPLERCFHIQLLHHPVPLWEIIRGDGLGSNQVLCTRQQAKRVMRVIYILYHNIKCDMFARQIYPH